MASKRLFKPKVSQWARVMFVDVGARDGVCMETGPDGCKLLFPYDGTPSWVEYGQIVSVGNMLTARDSGL